ncbi:MAG: hypothetical protein ACOCYO_07365, partial [Bacteroidota bacterium]
PPRPEIFSLVDDIFVILERIKDSLVCEMVKCRFFCFDTSKTHNIKAINKLSFVFLLQIAQFRLYLPRMYK